MLSNSLTESLEAHLARRRLTPSLYAGISINEAERTVVFPLWNLMGQMVGFQQYKPDAAKDVEIASDARYFTILSKAGKDAAITAFGIDQISLQRSRILFLSEGVFDVCPFHNRSVNALAALCNDPKHLMGWTQSLGYYTVAVCDGDSAGSKLATIADTAIYCPDGKDPGDMSDDFFDSLINQFIG